MILGITGFKGSGKDTFAQPFIEAGWKQLRFADPLKAMLQVLLEEAGMRPIDANLAISDPVLKEVPLECLWYKTPRYAMQTLGTEWRNMIHPRLWTSIMARKLRNNTSNVIITDVRFPHEVECLQEFGAAIVRISHAGCHETGHESECYIENLPVSMVINNNKGVAELHAEAKRLLLASTWVQ